MAEEFRCNTCPFRGPIEDFAKDPRRRKPWECKECKRKRSRKHYQSRKEEVYAQRALRRRFEFRELIRELKSKPCSDCGGSFHYCQMDFDHRDPSQKRLPISRMSLMSLKAVLEEIAKCDLVCANCHRDRTQRQVEETRIDTSRMTNRQRRQQESHEFVNSLKDGKKCADCGLPHPYWRLDFDHREGKQKTVSKLKLGRYSRERILEEVARCDLACVNCHRLRTWNRQRKARMGPT